MDLTFSTRINQDAEDLKVLMKLSENHDIISFSGGFPAPELFPIKEIKEITMKILDDYPGVALQYGASEGYTNLRELIASKMMKNIGIPSSLNNILITNGAQQGLDFMAKLFINKGDEIVVERPTYLGALTAFNAYEPEYLEVPMEHDGMDVSYLEELLKGHPKIKYIYTVPDFQNPTGITMSKEKRKHLCYLAQKYNVLIIEDNPYNELVFQGIPNKSIKSYDTDGHVIYLGTFSKTFCPGLRIGWVCANEEIIDKVLLCKQGADLQCGTLNQFITYEFLNNYDVRGHIRKLRKIYGDRKDNIVNCINYYFQDTVNFTNPKGGLFTYLTLPKNIKSKELLPIAFDAGVSFVPGDAFYALGNDYNHIRLNYSYMDKEQSELGIKILSNIIKKI